MSSLSWYAAKVKYRSEIKVKTYLETNGIEHFVPFRKIVIERNGRRRKVERPVINCFVFVRTTRKKALAIPADSGINMNFIYSLDTRSLLVIPDKQMHDFMFIINLDENALRIENNDLKRGDRVRVIAGPFAGIEGELVRIKGHKRVVVHLEGIFSIATTYIPAGYLEKV